MIRFPLVRRSDDDDYAPIDYSFVGSLEEGQRRIEAQSVHQNPLDPVIRRRADPYERGRVDEYGTRARRSSVARKPSNVPVRRGLPSLMDGPVPVEHVAYPQEILPSPPEPVELEILDPPDECGAEDEHSTRARRSSGVRRPSAVPAVRDVPVVTDSPVPVKQGAFPQEVLPVPPEPAGPEIFHPPVQPQIPEWLRVTQQNHIAQGDRRVRHPQITTAPNQPDLQDNLLDEFAYRAVGKAAEPPLPADAYDHVAPKPPRAGGPYDETKPVRNIPWLGMGGLMLVFLAAGLWLMGMSFINQKNLILRSQEEAAEAIQNSHPYRYRQLIETQAQIHNLHPAYIAAIVLNESSFNPMAESRVGARGLMQMMPDTAEWVHGKIGQGQPYSFDSMYDPDMNVRYACWYLHFLSERFRGDPVLVASAFHAGQNTVQNWLNDSRYSLDSRTIALMDMPEGPTKNYAARVMRDYAVYKRLYYEDL